MTDDVRVCPHCGAMVGGNTERCPRCDELLETSEEPSAELPLVENNLIDGIEDDEETEVLLSRPAQMTTISAEIAVESVPDSSPSAEVAIDEVVSEPDANEVLNVAEEPESVPPEDVLSTPEVIEEPIASDLPAVSELDDTGEHQATPPNDPLAVVTNDTPQNALQDTPPQGSNALVIAEQFEEAHTEPVTYGQLLRPASVVPMPEPLPALDTQPKMLQPLPPAPFTPPPIMSQPAAANTVSDQSYQQRVVAYAQGGYRLVQRMPTETVMSYGKSLSYLWWIIATASGFGIFWYWFILLVSGFRSDRVYIILEPDGYVYEEGPGAAHIRRRRTLNSRRWGVFGMFMLLVSVFSLVLAVLAGSVMLDRYQNELNAAYPELGLFSNTIAPNDLDATEVQNVRVAVLALLILSAISISGVAAGAMMAFVGYLQAAAYRVKVAPLPYMR